jgi:glycosyltransferase involved in cell wall biosynthesis
VPDVALISPYPERGERHGGSSGVASYTANLAHSLADAGAEVTVIAPRQDGQPESGRDGDVRVERAFSPGPAALPAAALAARRTGAPVVHLQHETFLYGGPASVAGLAAGLGALRGRRRVITLHHVVGAGEVDRTFTRLHRVRAPASAARAGLAVVRETSRRMADAVIVHEPAFAEAVPGASVVPHGVEAPYASDRAEARVRLGLHDEERLVALCFGFVAPYKGLDAALEAAREAPEDVLLVVAGGEHPRLASSGDDYAARLRDAYPQVRFTGRVPDADVAAWFAATDVALFPYPRPVSSSGALALALAHGTPALLSPELATCTGAPAELVASREPAELAARLRALAADRVGLRGLRDATVALAAERAWPTVARRHLDIYDDAANEAA